MITKQDIKEASAGLLAVVVLFVVGVVLCIVLGVMAVFGHGWFVDHTANRQGRTQQEQQINGNGSYRIAAYDHFFDLCAQVQNDESNISNTQDQLKTTTDPQEKLVLQTNLTAQKNERASDIHQYNADSAKAGTLAQFKSSNLPYSIDITQETTTCTA